MGFHSVVGPEIPEIPADIETTHNQPIGRGSDARASWRSAQSFNCLLYTSPSPRDLSTSRMPSSA